MNTSKGFVHLFLVIAVLVIAVVGIGYYALNKTSESVTSYSECIDKYGPDTTLIYPPRCTTPDGKTFLETADEQTDPTLSWNLYENSEFGFSLKYPAEWSTNGPLTDDDNTLLYIFANGKDVKIQTMVYVSKVNTLPDISFKETYINGISALETSEWPSQFGALSYFIRSENGYIAVSLSPYQSSEPYPNQEENVKTFHQILSTFEFIDSSTPEPTKIVNSKKLSYSLPSGWQTVANPEKTFQVGYDPLTHNTQVSANRVDLNALKCCALHVMQTFPYDGGSRHKFIYDAMGVTGLNGLDADENTIEVSYEIDGKSALFLYKVHYSSTNTVGMIVLNSKQAILYSSDISDQQQIEKMLKTINTNI